MRSKILWAVLFLGIWAGQGNAQADHVTLHVKNAPVEEVLGGLADLNHINIYNITDISELFCISRFNRIYQNGMYPR